MSVDIGIAKNTANWGEIFIILYFENINGRSIVNGISKTICLINSILLALTSSPDTCINVIKAYKIPNNGKPANTILIIGFASTNKLISLVNSLATLPENKQINIVILMEYI